MIYDLKETTQLFAQDKLPRIPEAYRLSEASRPLIHSVFVKQLGRDVRMEVAIPGDEHVLHDYAINEFFKQTPLFVTLGFQKDESIELVKSRLSSDLIADGRVILVTDESRLVGLAICRDVVVDRRPLKYNLDSDEQIDLTDEIDSMPGVPMPIAKYRSAIGLINAQMSFCVPEECERFCVAQMGHLHPSYRQYKLAIELGASTLMLAHSRGYRYVLSMSTSIAADKRTGAAGARRAFECQFSKFEYREKCIFPNGRLTDDLERASIFVLDLENF